MGVATSLSYIRASICTTVEGDASVYVSHYVKRDLT